MADIDDVLDRKRPPSRKVPICLDPDLANDLDAARQARSYAQFRADERPDDTARASALAEAEENLEAAIEAAKPECIDFVFKSMGRQAYEDLRGEHPPTAAQNKEYRKQVLATGRPQSQVGSLLYNADTFPPALIAACCSDPKMNIEQAKSLWVSDDFSPGELAQIFNAATEVNTQSRVVDLGEG